MTTCSPQTTGEIAIRRSMSLPAGDTDTELTVLRHAVFVNLQVGQDLDTRHQRRLGTLRQFHDFAQHAVDAAADLQSVLAAVRCGCRWRRLGGSEFQDGRQAPY
jgi:hypothetical protein